MTKSELIEIITAKQKHLPARDVELALKQILEIMSDALSQGERIEATVADWDAFTVEMRAIFKDPIDAEIEGAGEYLAALEKLAIRAKDVMDTALHLAHCQQFCLQRQWEMERDQRDLEIAQQRIDQLSDRQCQRVAR